MLSVIGVSIALAADLAQLPEPQEGEAILCLARPRNTADRRVPWRLYADGKPLVQLGRRTAHCFPTIPGVHVISATAEHLEFVDRGGVIMGVAGVPSYTPNLRESGRTKVRKDLRLGIRPGQIAFVEVHTHNRVFDFRQHDRAWFEGEKLRPVDPEHVRAGRIEASKPSRSERPAD